jgi:hypothetical protein
VIVALAVGILAACFSAIADHTHTCPDAVISINAHEPADYVAICNGATDALSFFERLKLSPMHPLVVEIVPDLPDVVGETAVGCYLEDEQRILVLTFETFRKNRKWFGVPVDRSMYRSIVTHEVAHAVADCNFKVPSPTIQAKEYVAYVAMFVLMPPELRKRILLENPGSGFDNELKINEIVYLFNPMYFGVQAYRHYLKDGHGDAFLMSVLSGKALTESLAR